NWSRDLSYTISTALTVEDRRRWERALLDVYAEELRRAGGPALDRDEVWRLYRQQLFTALAWWTVTLTPSPELPDMQPQHTAVEFIRRIATAIDDLDALQVT
ncbi:MAG: aminoglycoside phosphotransferase family protein, partial [Steroidobacteraceae bacterium]